MRGVIPIIFILLLVTASCGTDESTTSSAADDAGHEMGPESADFDFGHPGNSAEADRKVTVLALDSLRFEPDAIEIGAEETITFEITNDGEELHEFVIGDRDFQEQHAEDMEMGHSMEEGPNAVEIEPGATETITWTFAGTEDVLFACHEPGHYEGGMFGTGTLET